MPAQKKYKKGLGGLLEKGKDECCACINGNTREEWAKLVGCYVVFYSFLTAWFAIHLIVMVDKLPDRATYFAESPDGLQFAMGEARYWGFAEYAMTLANEFNGNSVPSRTPWSDDEGAGKPATGISTTNSFTYQQLRINNFYDIAANMRESTAAEAVCTFDSTKATISDATHPFFQYSYTSGTTLNGVLVTIAAGSVKVRWGQGANGPQIVQFKINANGAFNEEIQFSCRANQIDTNGLDYVSPPDFSVTFTQ